MDPLTIAALIAGASGATSLLTGLYGGKGGYEQIGGPSEEDIRARQAAFRQSRERSAQRGARTAARLGARTIAGRGGGRSGAPGALAGNIGAELGEQLGRIDTEAESMGAELRGLRRYEYVPSESEQVSRLTGQFASAVAPAVVGGYAIRGLAPAQQATQAATQALAGGAAGAVELPEMYLGEDMDFLAGESALSPYERMYGFRGAGA